MGGFLNSLADIFGELAFYVCELHPIKHPFGMVLDRPSETVLTEHTADKLPRFECEVTTLTDNRLAQKLAVSPTLWATHPSKALCRSQVIIPNLAEFVAVFFIDYRIADFANHF
jgi:hypothetical protein